MAKQLFLLTLLVPLIIHGSTPAPSAAPAVSSASASATASASVKGNASATNPDNFSSAAFDVKEGKANAAASAASSSAAISVTGSDKDALRIEWGLTSIYVIAIKKLRCLSMRPNRIRDTTNIVDASLLYHMAGSDFWDDSPREFWAARNWLVAQNQWLTEHGTDENPFISNPGEIEKLRERCEKFKEATSSYGKSKRD